MDYSIVRLLSFVELACSVYALVLMFQRRSIRNFLYLTLLLAVRVTSTAGCLGFMFLAQRHLLNVRTAYSLYFYVYWSSYALEAILSLMVVYSIFKLAMAPLKGLQTLGMLVFRWAAAISGAVAVSMALGPKAIDRDFLLVVVAQLQQTSGILTLCLLLFVCFAIRPMGLSFRSRIFGISLGLGLMATTDLAGAAWVAHFANMHSAVSIIDGFLGCLTIMIWSAYFALPEPKRRIIVLPTTSPFLRWNQISLALGDEPGFVAIGGIPPEVFAPAEIEVMRRASVKMTAESSFESAPADAAFQSLTA